MTTPNAQLAAPVESLAVLLERPEYKNRFREVLGQRAGEFCSSILSLQMHTMRDVEPKSILAAAMTAASLNLPINPNLGFAYIIAYKDNANRGGGKYAQFQIGYKGFVQLAMRTGKYRFMNCCAVCEGEFVKYDKLTGELIIDQDKKTSDKVVGYASYFKLVNGFEHAFYMTVEQVTKHGKQYSQSFKKGYGQWVDNFESMALKTVLKLNLSHWGVLSVEMEKAMYEDQGFKAEIDSSTTFIDNAEPIPQAQIADAPGGQTEQPAAAATTEAPATTQQPAAATPTAATTEKPPAKAPKKKAPKLSVVPPPPAQAETAAAAAPAEQAQPANARVISENERLVAEKVSAAGFQWSAFIWMAVFQKWAPAPEGYDREKGDVADLDGVVLSEDFLIECQDDDNWQLILEQLNKKKAEGNEYPK